jgi:iron complex transport system substrate-binding protein
MKGMIKNQQLYIVVAIIAAILLLVIFIPINLKPDLNSHPNEKHLRIISLAPNVTEMLFALGLQDCIVGVTDYCDWPPEAKGIECVGGLGAPNIEKLLTIAPDLVIATDFENKHMRGLIRSAGVQLLELEINTIEEVFESLVEIGQLCRCQERAARLVAELRSRLQQITDTIKEKSLSGRPRVFVEIWHDPVTTAGAKSFIDDVIRLAGGVNVAHEISSPYVYINPEKVIEWDPDVILTSYMISADDTAGPIEKRIGWSEISAVKQGRIISDIPAEFILRPGPRIVEGIKILSDRFYDESIEY